MDAKTVFDDLSLTLGQPSAKLPVEARARIITEMNATLQILSGAPKDFFLEEELEIELDGVAKFNLLDADVMKITGNMRHANSGRMLVEIPSKSLFNNYGSIYNGQSDRNSTAGDPIAYYVDGGKSATPESGSDSTQIEVYWWPKPDSTYSLLCDGIKRPDEITLGDLNGTQQEIEIQDIAATPGGVETLQIYGCRGLLALTFGTGPDPGTRSTVEMQANERAWVDVTNWTTVDSGAAILIAAIEPYYPTVYQTEDGDQVFIHVGAASYTDSLVNAAANFTVGTTKGVLPTAIKAPHGMVESVFMPIARFRLATFYRYFTDMEKLPVYAAQAQAALRMVGLDPSLATFDVSPAGSREGRIQD